MDSEPDHINYDRLSRDELADRRSEVRRELARVERNERKREQEFKFLQSMVVDIERMDEMSWEELVAFRSKLQRLLNLGYETGETNPETQEAITINAGIMMIDAMIEVRRLAESKIREVERQTRIARDRVLREHMEKEHSSEEVMCIECGKRPRHFGDYCKRCVPDELRPTGKV